jgi:uncharacterized protein YbjT (DUF2867 family)
MSTVLVAGASGLLGRQVVRELRARGLEVRALTRSAERGRSLEALGAQIIVGDALRPETLMPALDGTAIVFSCLGQSVSLDMANRGPGYHAVDYVGNHNLIAAAKAAGVQRFGYVSVFRAELFPQLAYMRAHADVAAELRSAGLAHAIICPTGFFSAFDAILDMARSGRGSLIGDGAARSNPIHDADLAEVCVDALLDTSDCIVDVGGPEVVSRRQIVEAAFAAVKKPVKITTMPAWAAGAMATLAMPFAPRIGELMAFATTMFTTDIVAPQRGDRRIAEYFADKVSGGSLR